MRHVTRTPVTVLGIPSLRLDGPGVSVTVTTGMGPRLLALAGPDGRNVLAELPHTTLPVPGHQPYPLLGGHRLWHTPEDPGVTYRRDDGPVAVQELPDGVDLLGAEDPVQGIRKRLRVVIDGGGTVHLEHEIRNTSAAPMETAAWAITQVPPRGEAWVPMPAGEVNGAFQPNRSIVLWPYTSMSDPRLSLTDPLAIVRGEAGAPGRVKVGTQRSAGWIAWRDGATVLVIRAPHEPGVFGDLGASTQCYSCADFVELETIGPVSRLAPGAGTTHRQAWSLHAVDPRAPREAVLAELGLAGS